MLIWNVAKTSTEWNLLSIKIISVQFDLVLVEKFKKVIFPKSLLNIRSLLPFKYYLKKVRFCMT